MPLAALGPILLGAAGTSAAATAGAWGAIGVGAKIGTDLIGASKTAGAAKDAAQLQTDAAKYGADKQDAAAQRAEAFQRQQAENEWLNSQNTQRANYEQSKARYGSIAGVASQYGLNLGGMPDYQPGVDPHYTDAGTPGPPAPGTVAGAAPAGQGDAGALKALLDSGMDPQQAVAQFNQKYGRTTGNQAVYYDPSQHGGVAAIGLPDAYLAKPGASWDITTRGGAGTVAGAAKATPYAMTAPVQSGIPPNTAIPTPYQPGTIGAAARRSY